MSHSSRYRSVLLQPVLAFITLCALLGVFALARTAHLIDAEMQQRAFGQIVGLMLMVMGNYLPKLRPLHTTRIDRARGASAERFAGRILLLAGLVSFAMCIGLPTSEAGLAAARLGAGSFVMIATHWSWLAYSARLGESTHTAPSAGSPAPTSREWRTSIWLLIGYAYICSSAWAMDLLGDSPLRDPARTWLVTGFSMLILVVLPFLELYPRGRCRSGLRTE